MAIKIQLRRGTAAEWTSANPVLMQGEMGVETDTLKVKIGNGTTAWTTLPYFTQGAKGDKGDQGIQGIQGVQGNTGPVGPVGPANSLSVGSVTTGIEGSDAEVTITGTAPNQTMSLVIPRGDKGDAATITVGTVTQVAAGQPATVTNSGTSAAAVLNFEIPNAVGVPTGGTAGQIVRKTASGTEWADMPPSQLSGQTDVSISSPQNKQVLKYDGSKWVNATASGGVTVSETTPVDPSQGDGWFFAADGTQFVRYDDGTSVQWVQPNAPLAAQVEQRYYSPNYIINGGFDFWQRGTSATNATGYLADRWAVTQNGTGASTNQSRVLTTLQGKLGYALRVSAGANASSLVEWGARQAIERGHMEALAGKTVTLSFWYRSNKTGTHGARIIGLGTGSADFTTGFTVVSADTWQRYSITTSVPFGNLSAWSTTNPIDIGSYVDIGFKAGNNGPGFSSVSTNDYFEITGVQLEEGTVATPFRRAGISLQGELAACQRYCYVKNGSTTDAMWGTGRWEGNTFFTAFQHPVQMRTSPSFTLNNVTGLKVVDPTIAWYQVVGINAIHMNGTTASDVNFSMSGASVTNKTFGVMAVLSGNPQLIVSAEL